jgi:D-alanyl-D-alanine carboxypeptidase
MFHPVGGDRPEFPMIEQISVFSGIWLNFGSLSRRVAMVLAALALLSGCSTTREVLDVPAKPQKYAALVVDAGNGKALYQSNATAPRYPASLTKMMTMYLVFEALDAGRLSKSTLIPVSTNAAAEPPTKVGLRPGDVIDVDTALRALAVKSANDVATAVGEYLGGSEQAFAGIMTAKARQLGMHGTRFSNASGLPDPAQQTTARDMAVLGMALRSRFAHHYHYFSERDFAYRGRLVRGHNDMLGRVEGVDGIKTGYIRASGYNIVTSVKAGGRSLVIVVMGADSARARNAHVEELIGRYLLQASGGSRVMSLFGRSSF